LVIFDKKLGKIWDYAWSPDGRYLGFLANITRLQEKTLYLLDTVNAEIRILTTNSHNVVAFAWHPDDDILAFSDTTGTDETNSSIWIVDINESAPKKLEINLTSNMIENLAWSPNGERLSFTSTAYSDGIRHVSSYIVDDDGQNLVQLDTYDRSIIWSPLENKIGMVSDYSFVVQDLSQNEVSELINLPEHGSWIMDNVRWSPDGKYIAYRVQEIRSGEYIEFPNSSVHVFSIDNSDDYQLTDMAKSYDNIAWSPNSSRIAFTKCEEDQCGIYTANIYSMSVVEIAHYPGVEVSQLNWRPSIILNPSIIPPTSTPIASWNLLPIPPLYDDFESNDIDNDKWGEGWGASVAGSSGYYSYKQDNGVLEIKSNGTIQSEDFGLPLTGARSISQIQAFEARLKISRGSQGFAFVKIQISADLDTYDWYTQCRLGGSLQKQPTFICDIAKSLGGYGIVYQTDAVSINFDQWYVVRIEIQPDSGAVQYYLDGNLLSTYVPDDVDELTQENVWFYPNIGAWVSNGSITAYVDNVRITEMK